jgi:diguanylate cyclase (GGDEF)-like protein/PAS domain S-box-containing protein
MVFGSRFENKVLVAFVSAMVVVTGLACATWMMAGNAREAARLVAYTQQVLEHVSGTRAETLQIEFSTQSFRISGDPARLVERDAAIAKREALLAQISQLTGDNPLQHAHMQRLRAVVAERLAISHRVEQLRKTQGQEAAATYAVTAPLQATRELTHNVLQDMEQEERHLLDLRIAEQARTRVVVVALGVVASALLLLLLIASYVLIRREVRAGEASSQALAQSEESLAITLYSIGDAVLATDTQGCITRMNPVAERLTGWTLTQAAGQPVETVFRIVNAITREPADVPVTKALRTGEVQELDNHTVLIAQDGSEVPISDSAAPIRDAAGHVRGVVMVFRDVSIAQQMQHMVRHQNQLLEQRVQERTAQLTESEQHLNSVINNVPALIAYVDGTRHYVYVNRQYRSRFAPELADFRGRSVQEILGEERYAQASPLITQVLQGESQCYDWEPFPGVWLAVNYLPRWNAAGQVSGYYVLGSDITERKNAEHHIQALNTELHRHVADLERTSRILRTLSAGNRTMLRATDEMELLESMCRTVVETGGYAYAIVWYRSKDTNKSLRPMAGVGHADGLAALYRLKTSWADDADGQRMLAKTIRTGQTHVALDMRADPSYASRLSDLADIACGIACPLRVGGETIGAFTIYAQDPHAMAADEEALFSEMADDLAFGIATLRARLQRQEFDAAMLRLTHFDALTGLPNETQFTEFLTAAIASGALHGKPFSVLQTNVGRLNEINDAMGFGRGDELLRQFGDRLCVVAPAPALVARLRGDEFAILLPDSYADDAINLARQVEAVLARPFAIADIEMDVSATMGVALYPQHGVTPHDLFRHVDSALNVAKKRGVSHHVYDPEQNKDQTRRLNVAGELRRAIEGGDLLLYLQPKVDMRSGAVCGVEGLVRWMHAERGLIPPVEFIGLAEHTGLIRPLTEWVIETALRLNRDWAQQGCALPIAVNLSARNLRDEKLVEKIRNLKASWGTAAGLLELEITESTVMDDAEFALNVLHSLRAEGIPLYIDDFGTGYSSLTYLQKLPVDYIKIDQSFVQDMTANKASLAIVRSTIDLVHDLGRLAVAEGVETQEHWDRLSALGCDFAQGYWIARPMPAEQLQPWLAQYRPPTTHAVTTG